MTDISQKQTSLHLNPFWVLGVTTRDDRRRIVEQAEERALHIDHDLCQKARSDLTNPRNRLSAEISWLPGVSPKKAERMAQGLLDNPKAIRAEAGLPDLARANLMAASIEIMKDNESSTVIAQFFSDFASVVEAFDADEILRDINEDRAVAGFPEVQGTSPVEEELVKRRKEYRNAIKHALDAMPSTKLVETMTRVVSGSTDDGATHGPALIDDLVDAYEIETQGFLDRETENITTLIESIRSAAPKGAEAIESLLKKLEQVARNWDKVAQPIQLSMKSRGISHSTSQDIAVEIRSLGIDLYNKHDMLVQAERITNLLKDLFAELPEFMERVEEDSTAIKGIQQKAREAESKNQQWERDITYRADVGVVFKDELSISPKGISWKGTRYPLESITRVYWGATRHSVNGVPTGTTYNISFGDNRSLAEVSLRNETTFDTFIDKLWRAVAWRLMVDIIEALKAGKSFSFGDIKVEDESVTLTKHKFFGNERVKLTWHEVTVWSANGNFLVGSSTDNKTYGTANYISTANTHILEHILRNGFKKGISRLSDFLKD